MSTKQEVRILIADPDATCVSALEEAGYQVTFVRSGTSAMEKGALRPYDMVLVSYPLTDLNGGIVCDNIKQFPWKRSPIVILFSRVASPPMRMHSQGLHPADLYLEGEEAVATLLAAVGSLLKNQKPESMFLEPVEKVVKKIPIVSPIPATEKPVVASVEPPQLQVSEEVEVLRRELEIAHQELNELNSQLNDSRENIKVLEEKMARVKEEPPQDLQKFKMDIERLKAEAKERQHENSTLRDKLRVAEEGYNKLRERVKMDLEGVREREHELLSQMETIRRDADQLIKMKDSKIMALKKQFEDIHFEIERRDEKILSSNERIKFWKDRVGRVTKALKLAVTMLEGEGVNNHE